MLIYQDDIGGDNAGKTPLGGVMAPNVLASSMVATIANPITYYVGSPYTVISQTGHSRDLYDYYWSSYSRGTDGKTINSVIEPQWHNDYLDGYIPLRVKSIYDPCPYLYRIPSHGSWNQFKIQSGWTWWSYLGGVSWNMTPLGESWLLGLGLRGVGSSVFGDTGRYGFYFLSTAGSQNTGYTFEFVANKGILPNRNDLVRSYGFSVRCIEELH